ncbi:MAG: AmmeMemoRadiSam system protein B [Candidatus Magasanikbacteria bacterium]|nr:AmmeMemoRadiSam system protein B [Candidatus Magasanikbacteria bacterium]
MLNKTGQSKTLKITAIAFVGLVVIFLLIFYKQQMLTEIKDEHSPVFSNSEPYAETVELDYNWELFYSAIENGEKTYQEKDKKVYGGIIPHHDLVSDYIAEFFSRLKETENPKTIIILGPNHIGQGVDDVISGRVDWRTPFGVVENNYTIIDELVASGLVSYDNENFIPEHSIKNTVAFVSYYFPKADIVPLVILSNKEISDMEKLADRLAEYSGNDEVLVIGSFDFSHYLTPDESVDMDKITWDAIENRAYSQILMFDNTYIDAPAALIVLLKTMDMLGASDLNIIRHSNSGKYLQQNIKNSTSYFTAYFTQGD